MTAMELARFTVDPDDVDAMLEARPAMLRALRERFDGFEALHLVRLDERTWLDVVRWASRAQADEAAAVVFELPECRAAFAYIKEVVAMEHGEILFAGDRVS
jgi:heme-degrading monooxygenase HmoA